MSSFWKDLRSNPRVLSFFTCLGWLYSYFCTYKPLRCRLRMTLRFFCFLLWTVIFKQRSSVTEFVGWRPCLIVFKTFSDRSGNRTHAHTRVPEFSTEDFLEPGALDRWAIRPCFRRHIFSFDLWPFHWVNFSIPRCTPLNGLCHPFEKVFVQTHAYIRVAHVFAGYLLSCALLKRSAFNTDDVASLLFSFALGCHLELTFQYDRICQLKALPHLA